MPMNTLIEEITSWCICSDYAQTPIEQIDSYLSSLENWDKLIEEIEFHGLSPAFYAILSTHHYHIPKQSNFVLKALVIKHKLRWENFNHALVELNHEFKKQQIDFVLLKGCALANQIYPKPAIRCMEDIDILIDEKQIEKIQPILKQLNYRFEEQYQGYLKHHHHLPGCYKTMNGQTIMLELHKQALSEDMNTTISFTNLSDPPLPLHFSDCWFKTLSHRDALKHLCLHTFSRDSKVKLSGLIDILRYVDKFDDEIDWKTIEREDFFVINTIRLTQCMFKLSNKTAKRVSPINAKHVNKIKGVGLAMAPLRQLSDNNIPIINRIKNVFFPSTWWLHNFYAIKPEDSILLTKYFRHPLVVCRWIIKKLLQDRGL